MATVTPKSSKKVARASSSLTLPDLVVLGLLAERPMHGYELLRVYAQQEVKEWAAVSRPHVYYTLKKLNRLALIKASKQEGLTDNDRTVFHVTKAGEAQLAKNLSDSRWATSKVPPAFTTWLGLSIHLSKKQCEKVIQSRIAFLEAALERKRKGLVYIESLDSARVPIGKQMIQFDIRQLELEMKWLASLTFS